jgi:hypothetical protein
MKHLIIIAALAGVLLGAPGVGVAQQPAPSAGPEPATCSGQAAFCKSGCGDQGHDRQCVLACEKNLVECKATGLWKNLKTGQMLPRRKE